MEEEMRKMWVGRTCEAPPRVIDDLEPDREDALRFAVIQRIRSIVCHAVVANKLKVTLKSVHIGVFALVQLLHGAKQPNQDVAA